MNVFQKIRAGLRFNEAVRKADEAHAATGERYYVMPLSPRKLIVMDRSNFRKLKQKRYIDNKASVLDLERECFYCTPYRNGTGMLPSAILQQKRNQYLAWYNSKK